MGKRDNRRWSLIGTKVVNTYGTRALKKVTLLLAVSNRGRFFMQLIQGSAITPIFASYLLALRRYNGEGKLVIQLDNASFHKTSLTLAAASLEDITVSFLPAYFPEGNCVEMFFAKIKRALYSLSVQDIQDTIPAIKYILSQIPRDNYIQYFRRSFKNTLFAVN